MVMSSEQIVTIFSQLVVYFMFIDGEYMLISNYMYDMGVGVIRPYLPYLPFWRETWWMQMFEFWWCIKVEKQAEVLIDKYYFCAKVIHKGVLDIY